MLAEQVARFLADEVVSKFDASSSLLDLESARAAHAGKRS